MKRQRDFGHKILWLDEVNFTKLSIDKHAWSRMYSNIEVDQSRIYRGYTSVCATIAQGTGVEALAIQKKAFNRWEYIQYLYWLRYINGDKPLCIFMDNLSVHKTRETYDAYRTLDIHPIFNLAYSPDYNPIESIFSQVKRIFNRERLSKLANDEDFNETKEVEDAFYKVTPNKIDPCIKHSEKLLNDLDK